MWYWKLHSKLIFTHTESMKLKSIPQLSKIRTRHKNGTFRTCLKQALTSVTCWKLTTRIYVAVFCVSTCVTFILGKTSTTQHIPQKSYAPVPLTRRRPVLSNSWYQPLPSGLVCALKTRAIYSSKTMSTHLPNHTVSQPIRPHHSSSPKSEHRISVMMQHTVDQV